MSLSTSYGTDGSVMSVRNDCTANLHSDDGVDEEQHYDQ